DEVRIRLKFKVTIVIEKLGCAMMTMGVKGHDLVISTKFANECKSHLGTYLDLYVPHKIRRIVANASRAFFWLFSMCAKI
ncbi:hypothetical protein, partial [Salmonella sp. s51884]|uniref:hypothetical protein n=1 Tax=Salmonella sp. s51884 TaxID=3159654 RepID=UPI003980813A